MNYCFIFNALTLYLYGYLSITIFVPVESAQSYLTQISDPKVFKKFIKTHINVMAIFMKSEKEFTDKKLFEAASIETKGIASIIYLDCSFDKKLCKKLKVNPSKIEFKHYKDGEYFKDYDRKFNLKSLTNFLRDPKGEMPWDEDDSAVNVRHIFTKNDFVKLISKEKKPMLIMFYTPWCGYCKKLKPDFALAATEIRNSAVLVGVDLDRPDLYTIRTQFNISGYPTLLYFENGSEKFKYGGENSKEGIIKWLKNPEPPKEEVPEPSWSETVSDVVHLTDLTFDDFIANSSSVLVMFYAPWCGHCKKMKPEFVESAAKMKAENVNGFLAAVDATKETIIGNKLNIKGYPTVKYYKDGQELFESHHRTADALFEFMKNPQPPPPEEAAWDQTESDVEHLTEENFSSFIKKKKHCLVMFYAPWCGHCKKAKPEFTTAAEHFKHDTKVSFAAVDCTKHQKVCESQTVSGYPTIVYFSYGKSNIKYSDDREANSFITFMTDPTADPMIRKVANYWAQVEGSDALIRLNGDGFEAALKEHNMLIVLFYSLGCEHCTKMRPAYVDAYSQLKKENFDVAFAIIDGAREVQIRTKYDITGFPSILLFRDGELFSDMNTDWTTENIVNFVKKPAKIPYAWTNYPGSVKHLTAMNFDKMAAQTTKMFVMFYLPNCPHCNAARPEFWDASDQLEGQGSEAVLAVVDCSKYADFCKSHGIVEYPKFKLYTDATETATYSRRTRSAKEFLNFISEEGLQLEKDSTKTEL